MGGIAGRRQCLIVEDQALVAMAVECAVEDTGAWRCDLASSAAQALRCIEDKDYDAAILDYMLQNSCCTALAATLSQRGIPFLIFSDYRPPADLPPVLREAPWIEKLADPKRVLRALCSLTVPQASPLAAVL